MKGTLLNEECVRARAVAGAPVDPARAQAGPVARVEIPLSALRLALDEGSAQAHWSVDPDRVPGRALVQSAGSVVTVPLRLGGAVGFSAQVRLLPHDWRDGVGALRAWVAVTDADGAQRTLWSGILTTPPCRTRASRAACRCTVRCRRPAPSLKLGIDPRGSGTGPPGRPRGLGRSRDR